MDHKISFLSTVFFLSFLSFQTWKHLRISNLSKSTIHSILTLYVINSDIPSVIISIISTGYYLNDLSHVKSNLFIIHHLFSIIQCNTLLFYPYEKHNLLKKIMIVEASVPLLNLYICMNRDNKLKKLTLFVYLLVHIYYRNYLILCIYTDNVPKLLRDGMPYYQVYMFQLFIAVNYYWSFTTFKKLIQ